MSAKCPSCNRMTLILGRCECGYKTETVRRIEAEKITHPVRWSRYLVSQPDVHRSFADDADAITAMSMVGIV